MPSSKTECSELSVAFGILGIEYPFRLSVEKIEKYFEGTLEIEKYYRFIVEYEKRKSSCKRLYTVGFQLRGNYRLFRNVNSLKWSGPQQQASTTAAARDLIVSNISVSIKENSNVVLNPSPYNLFNAIPRGLQKSKGSKNWYFLQAPQEYQQLYSFIRSRGLEHLPEDVGVFEREVPQKDRRIIKTKIKQLSKEDKKAFERLYQKMNHHVAMASANLFNENFSHSMNSRSKRSILEYIAQHFFRIDSSDYILCGIDKNQTFAVVIPEMTNWKRNWEITNVIAEPELDRKQCRVRFRVRYRNRSNKKQEFENSFHAEVRWSHGKFQGSPEAKLYKDFEWIDVGFVKKIYETNEYIKLRIIGKGSYGIVYEAKYAKLGKNVAMKVFQSDFGATNEDIERFRREVRIMSELEHPNIMPVLDHNLTENNNLWFVMPLAKTNIADIANELKGDIERIHSIFRQVLVGIAYAHKKGIVHRDIKPQNILLFDNDTVKIGDLGLGKHFDETYDTSALTASDEFLGTFVYAAPEQFDHPTNVDNRADIYALGKTLIHMITGSPPPLNNSNLLGITNAKYRKFITRCIQNDPLLRFQSVEEMIEDFDVI